uniref:Uncharacterized protein n=1 Tax=Arundo donax TaxID=35708 RepID=A0A0A9H686_ARUDO
MFLAISSDRMINCLMRKKRGLSNFLFKDVNIMALLF